MSNSKGVTWVLIRKSLQERGPDFEKHVLSQVTEKERNIYFKANVHNWYPVTTDLPDEKTLLTITSKALFPNDPQPLRSFGKMAADHAINNLYKLLFRIPSVYSLVKRAALAWRTYNDTGAFYVEAFLKEGRHISFQFVLKQYPTLPENVREMLAGYYGAVMTWTGAKTAEVSINQSYTEVVGWRWTIMAHY